MVERYLYCFTDFRSSMLIDYISYFVQISLTSEVFVSTWWIYFDLRVTLFYWKREDLLLLLLQYYSMVF